MNDTRWALSSRKEKVVLLFSAALVALALLCNHWVVAYFLTYDNELSIEGRVFVWAFQLVTLAAGVLIFRKCGAVAARISFSKPVLIGVAVSVILIFGALEISARILDSAGGNKFTAEQRRGQRELIPFRVFGPSYYTSVDGERYLQSLHKERYPLAKGPDTVRIVVFGGSTTGQIQGGIHYPKALEEKLQEHYPDITIEVINTAFAAYATPHSLIILNNDVLSWDPDIVILSHNINDLTAAYFPNFTPDYANKYGHEFYTKPDSAAITTFEKLYEWSTLYWVIDQQFKALAYRRTLGDEFYRRKSYGDEPPREAAGVFRRNLTTFVRTARDRGIDVVLGTQPHETSFAYFDKQMRWKPYSNVIVYPLHEEYVAHHAAYNDIIRDVAFREGATLVENTGMSDVREYFTDNVHNTETGIRTLADSYFNTLVAAGIIR